MKNLSTLFLAMATVLVGASLYAQNSGPQSGFSNPGATNINSSGYQPGMNTPSQNTWGSQANTQNSNTWGNQANTQNSSTWGNQANTKNPSQWVNDQNRMSNQSYIPSSDTTSNYARSSDFVASDDGIARKIRWAIRDDKNLSPVAKSAEVTVKNFNVTLTGTVNSEEEKSRIASIARQITGVKSVSNNLTISNR